MTLRHPLLTLATFLAIAPLASAGQSSGTGAPGTQANRIVGLWSAFGHVSPCNSGLPPQTVNNTLLFHAGGTVSENTTYPPSGLPNGSGGVEQRNNGLGTWSYDTATRTYTFHLRFDWWVDGVYQGYQTIDRLIVLSADGLEATGPVRASRYALDGSVIGVLCGDADMTRLY